MRRSYYPFFWWYRRSVGVRKLTRKNQEIIILTYIIAYYLCITTLSRKDRMILMLPQSAKEWLTQMVLRSSYIASTRISTSLPPSTFPCDLTFMKTSKEILRHIIDKRHARNVDYPDVDLQNFIGICCKIATCRNFIYSVITIKIYE